MKILAITGHRPQKLNNFMKYGDILDVNYVNYLEYMRNKISEYVDEGFTYFISGGAIGVDQDFAEAVLFEKKKNSFAELNKIILEIAVPCKNQDIKWKPKDRIRYLAILKNADIVNLLSKGYTPYCMFNRNKYMVDKADKILAFWDGEKVGGTWNTIQYANKIGKEVEIIFLSKLYSDY